MAALSEQADVQILDLRHFSARDLRPVLEEESRVWSTLLRWDYRGSAELLLQYLDSRVLPGYVALHAGKVCGYVFCVYEGAKAVVGDVFVSRGAGLAEDPKLVEDLLLEHLLEMLTHSPGTDRIEVQMLPHRTGTHGEVFARYGFRIYRRLFLELDLRAFPRRTPGFDGEAGAALIRPWREQDFPAAGPLIAAAYAGHLDAVINDQYRSLAGSLRFLHNIVRFPGCGVFDPDSSFVAQRAESTELTGVVLCSRVAERVGHVTQLCVAREARQQGLGAALLTASAESLVRREFEKLTLTVTEENRTAIALYQRLGFVRRHAFDAMVWER